MNNIYIKKKDNHNMIIYIHKLYYNMIINKYIKTMNSIIYNVNLTLSIKCL